MINKPLFSFFVLLLFSVGCTDSFEEFEAYFGDIILDVDRKVATFDGTVNNSSLGDLTEMLNTYSTVETFNINTVTGNQALTFAFEMGELLRTNNISTNIMNDGHVDGAGVYLFLGGSKKSISGNGKIGVNSWTTSNGQEVSQLPEDDDIHDAYIEYLERMGLSKDDADAFYFFSLNAAPSGDIYYLTDQDISEFKLLN